MNIKRPIVFFWFLFCGFLWTFDIFYHGYTSDRLMVVACCMWMMKEAHKHE